MHWLFNTDLFVPKSHCGIGWNSQLSMIYQLANILIFLAYFSIPIALFGFWNSLRKLPILKGIDIWIIISFVIFIASCGFGHLLNVMMFWFPAYRFLTLIDTITAISSVITALILPNVIAKLLKEKGFFHNAGPKA
jgi:hypothetical protein